MKVAELVAEAELNLQGISSDDAKEKGGLKLKGDDVTSLEAGIGLKLRKRIALAKEKELMLALGTKYYHELLDPYKDLTVGTSAAEYHIKGYDEDKNRLRTAAEAAYKEEMNRMDVPQEPVLFMKPDSALLKSNKPFFIPDFSERVEYETEIIIRICRLGKNISERFASRY